MKCILKHKYSEGNTPIRPEDAAQPILEISALQLAPKCNESRMQQIGRELRECVRIRSGGVAERFNAAVLKTVRLERVSGVRIPPPPPDSLLYSPDRSFTERSEDIVYTFGPKGLFRGCRIFSSRSK
jgi:hypothetical protein